MSVNDIGKGSSQVEHTAFYEYLDFDGAALFTAVFLPKPEGRFPTVIIRHPYLDVDRERTEEEILRLRLPDQAHWLDAGYAVVLQHCRGTGKSGGDFVPYLAEREDGLALQSWIRRQPFYNRELYLCGSSYTSSVHFVTAPFASDIKGAVLQVQTCERYDCNYRNGIYKMGLHGGWYVRMYKKNGDLKKAFSPDAYRMLPLSDFSRAVLGEPAPDFDEVLRHPDRDDPFWTTSRYGGAEAHDAIRHARIPILLVTGFYDIYTGSVFDMWNRLDGETKGKSALLVHPYGHGGKPTGEPICFERATLDEAFGDYAVRWFDAVRGLGEYPVPLGAVTYYQLFGDAWHTDDFAQPSETMTFSLGEGTRSYRYNPYAPASFEGGLSANFGGNAWQGEQSARYDVVSLFTPIFEKDTPVKGKMAARLRVSSSAEDTCFYMRISLVKEAGTYGLRDDINQISNFRPDYTPGETVEIPFSFDEHAFVIGAGERLRIDISSSAFPHYVPHTNRRGLFSEQTTATVATNTVFLGDSSLTLPIES